MNDRDNAGSGSAGGEQQEREVRIVTFPETKIAVFRHRGDPARIAESVRRFVEWRKEHGLSPAKSATFNIIYDSPDAGPPESFRLDLCAAVDSEYDTGKCGMLFRSIPEGRCAVLRHAGPDDRLGESVRYLVLQWFPSSGEERRNFPIFLQRYPERSAAAESVVDIFLPLA